jgi:uncharacterized protein DUF664
MIEEYARHNGHADLIRERIGLKILTYQTPPNDEGRITVIVGVRAWPYDGQEQRTAGRAKLAHRVLARRYSPEALRLSQSREFVRPDRPRRQRTPRHLS